MLFEEQLMWNYSRRIKIESKEKARERGVPSPDRAEALMLALCKPPQTFEYYSVRDLPYLSSGPDAARRARNAAEDRPRGALRGRRFWDSY